MVFLRPNCENLFRSGLATNFWFGFLLFQYCDDRKARGASAQSIALWQQATIEITEGDRSVVACSRHIYMATQ